MWRSSDSQVRSIRQDRTRIVILILTSLLAGCISTGGYIKGQVIDADTGEPIANAHVAIIWKGDAFAFVETQSADIRADATLTVLAMGTMGSNPPAERRALLQHHRLQDGLL